MAGAALVIAGCVATPPIGTRLDADVRVTGGLEFAGDAVFEMPATLTVTFRCAAGPRPGV